MYSNRRTEWDLLVVPGDLSSPKRFKGSSQALTLEEVWSSWTRPSGRAMMVMPMSRSSPMWRLFPAWNSDARSFLLSVLREGQTLFTKFLRGRRIVSANS